MSALTAPPANILTWYEIAAGFSGMDCGLLVGNGSSCAVSSKFGYASLYEAAKGLAFGGLTADDIAVFVGLRTESFEHVLAALRMAGMAFAQLRPDVAATAKLRESSIRRALLDAVKEVHVENDDCDEDRVLLPIGRSLRDYGWVFSTNYDLILYWSINRYIEQQKKGNRLYWDFFYDGEFVDEDWASSDVEQGRRRPRILYLHGGLHLFTDGFSESRKLQRAQGRSILELAGGLGGEDGTPLFVAEGSGREKVRTIRGSEYLRAALRRYDEFDGPLVVFGHSLSESDEHLVKPIEARPSRRVAISVHSEGRTPSEILTAIRRYEKQCHPVKPTFFHAHTHPLGDPNMRVI